MTNAPIQISMDLKDYLESFKLEFSKIDGKFAKLDQKLDKMDEKFEQKLDKLDEKFERKLDSIQKEVTEIRVELEVTKGNIKTLEVEVLNVKKRVEEVDTVQKVLVKDVSDLKGVKSLIIPALIAVLASSLTFFYRFIPIN